MARWPMASQTNKFLLTSEPTKPATRNRVKGTWELIGLEDGRGGRDHGDHDDNSAAERSGLASNPGHQVKCVPLGQSLDLSVPWCSHLLQKWACLGRLEGAFQG